VQRLPTAHLLPIYARTEIRHFRFKRAASDKNTSLLVAEEVTRPIEQFGHIVARRRCRTALAAWGVQSKTLRCAAMFLTTHPPKRPDPPLSNRRGLAGQA